MMDEKTLFLQLTPEELWLMAEGLFILQMTASLWGDEKRVQEFARLAEKAILAGKAQDFFSPEALRRLGDYQVPGEDE